ncbi:MAG: AtpZ/AtpI family protein [Firmicutes bacterium]|nr:AtpZ/AtpI family protein [Bacillota bacterium]
MKANKKFRLIALAASFTFFLAGSLALGYLIGNFFAGLFGGRGLFTALFIFLGILSGFLTLYRFVGKKRQ